MIPSITDSHIEELQAKTGLVFDQERRKAIKGFSDIQACPGSGKTTLIAAKLILLAKSWQQSTSGICVLSHTNVAKNEIISRLEGDEYGHK
ncbi:UvrD-helicase domain-containing protein, partial [Vibrio splendidus]|uniref:UvrD-helicase domain-containing protein n=1 Tax=Vibrio splendidus TaxID=29497 RepID=UPI003D0CCA58